MGKETKIGLAVIGVLLVVFGGVLLRSMFRKPGADANVAASKDAADGKAAATPKTRTWVRAADDVTIPTTDDSQDVGNGDEQPSLEVANRPRRTYAPIETGGDTAAADASDQPAAADAAASTADAAQDQDTDAAGERPARRGSGLLPADEPELTPSPDAAAADAAVETDSAGQPADEASDDASNSVVPTAGAETAGTRRGSPFGRAKAAADDQPDADNAAAQPDNVARLDGPSHNAPATLDVVEETSPPRRVAPVNGKYVVEPNDNFWTISEKVYGSGGYFKALQEHNKSRFASPDDIQVGDEIDTPPVEELVRRYAALAPKARKLPAARKAAAATTRASSGEKTYTVSEGDSLFDIARYELGKASRWAEIYELNRDVLGDDFHFLQPGTELVLPSGRGEAITRRPGGNLQR